MVSCPNCESPYGYSLNSNMYACPECGNEWNPDELKDIDNSNDILDANGNVLNNGDNVIVVKNLPVKGAPKLIKSGTKVKNIRLTDGANGHNINCKIDGFGAMLLKSEFVKKINVLSKH